MRSVQAPVPGGSETLALLETPAPVATSHDVVVEVVAAGVNRADVLQRRGLYPPPPGAPSGLGLEVSGVVRELGSEVTGVAVGDEVCALVSGGGCADQVAVPASMLLPVPAGVSLVDSAALPEAALTAWTNLVDAGGLRAPGGSGLASDVAADVDPSHQPVVLVHGGSGGVGSFAIQLAVALGARVLTTASGEERTARCLELGADVAIDHRTADVVEEVRTATDGHGVDVVLDVLGAGALERNLRCLAPGGRLVVVGLQQGVRGELDLGLLMRRRATVTGSTLRSRPLEERAAITAAVRQHVWPLVEAGLVRPVVHARLPLEDVAEAHRALEAGEVFGKILLLP